MGQADPFDPKNYLVPGWNGQSLISKSGVSLRRLLELTVRDVEQQLVETSFNRSLKHEVYSEFLAYAEHRALQCPLIDSPATFFQHLHREGGPYVQELGQFKTTFATRVATIYLFKIRLMAKLAHASEQNIHETYLRNPNFYFATLFKKGSSSQLTSLAMNANHYSWYRPKAAWIEQKFDLIKIYQEVSPTELQKIFSPSNLQPGEKIDYSHSFSHLSFGVFLCQLMTQFPSWIGQQQLDQSRFLHSALNPSEGSVLATQYCGDHLESLALSLGLAQEQSRHALGSAVICPEFCNSRYRYGVFARLAYELQFLCSLVDTAKHLNHNPIAFITKTYRLKENSKRVAQGQQSLFNSTTILGNNAAYDRIVLNLTQFPSNNPHHFLVGQIHSKVEELKVNGLLIVLSSKKLFIPSLSDRVEELLKDFKLESALTFEQLKGRGEIPPYIYILSKRDQFTDTQHLSSDQSQAVFPLQDAGIQKHPCLSFRISGSLKAFTYFSIINQCFSEFFHSKSPGTIPLYQKELAEELTFEFYQDAMVDGRLINTTNKDTSKITHPSFFKNLMRSCHSLSYFFQVKQIQTDLAKSGPTYSQDLLGISLTPQDQYRYILIVDYRNKSFPRLEFIPSDTFEAKLDEYGQALCAYFGLIAKIKDTNINLFRYFFKTQLGQQILQISLNDGLSRLKAKVGSILVPGFFEMGKHPPPHVINGLSIYHYQVKDFLKCDAQELLESYLQLEKLIPDLAASYPCYTMGLLVLFEQKINTTGDEIWVHENCFENKTFINSLVKCAVQPLYPNNPEIFVQFHAKKASELDFPLASIALHKEDVGKEDAWQLKLHTAHGSVVSFYAHKNMIKFLEFILAQAKGARVCDILGHGKVPSVANLSQLIEQQKAISEVLLQIKSANQKVLSDLVYRQLH